MNLSFELNVSLTEGSVTCYQGKEELISNSVNRYVCERDEMWNSNPDLYNCTITHKCWDTDTWSPDSTQLDCDSKCMMCRFVKFCSTLTDLSMVARACMYYSRSLYTQ